MSVLGGSVLGTFPYRGFIYAYRARRTAGYLHVSNVIFIVTYTSALKIRAHGRHSALKRKPLDSVWRFRTSVYFYVYKVAMRTNSRSLVAMNRS